MFKITKDIKNIKNYAKLHHPVASWDNPRAGCANPEASWANPEASWANPEWCVLPLKKCP